MCSARILTSVKSQGFRTDATLSSTSPSPRTLKRKTKQQHSCLHTGRKRQPWGVRPLICLDTGSCLHPGCFWGTQTPPAMLLQWANRGKLSHPGAQGTFGQLLESSIWLRTSCAAGCSSAQHLPLPATQRPLSPAASGSRGFFISCLIKWRSVKQNTQVLLGAWQCWLLHQLTWSQMRTAPAQLVVWRWCYHA